MPVEQVSAKEIDEGQFGEKISADPIDRSTDPIQADFNNDGFSDLAIGAPNKAIGGVRSGAVTVLYGSQDGLRASGSQLLTGAQVYGHYPRARDEFGYVLATGKFDNDGYDDLAVGIPGADDTGSNAGTVAIFLGSAQGLQYQGTVINTNVARHGDEFGRALTVGDFGDDAHDDLAVGAPRATVNGQTEAGKVHVFFGSPNGLSRRQSLDQTMMGFGAQPDTNDKFGFALTAGDFNGDSDVHDDLAIGVPGENTSAGWVHVLYGNGTKLATSATGNIPAPQSWHQGSSGIEGRSETGDEFGHTLAAGNFDGDEYDDLAVGVPFEDLGSKTDAGAVTVIYGRSHGLDEDDDEYWHQGRSGIKGSNERYDWFGRSLVVGNFDDDREDDLAIGIPGEDLDGGKADAGMVDVLYGTRGGLSSNRDDRWKQGRGSIKDKPEDGDHFGAALSMGDFDGDGAADLVIGVPFENVNGQPFAGLVHVIYGDDNDGLEDDDNQVWHLDNMQVPKVSLEAEDMHGRAVR